MKRKVTKAEERAYRELARAARRLRRVQQKADEAHKIRQLLFDVEAVEQSLLQRARVTQGGDLCPK